MKDQRGQSVLEILIATAFVAVVLVGLLVLGTNSLKSTSYSRNLNQASDYANQGVDWLRNMRQTLGWNVLKDIFDEDTPGTSLTYCLNTLPDSESELRAFVSASCVPETYISATTFWREATIDLESIGQGVIAITITTFWQNTITHDASVQIKLTQWN